MNLIPADVGDRRRPHRAARTRSTPSSGFVGSPAMNLLPADVAPPMATVLRGAGGWELPLSDRNARKAQASSNGKVVLGARHSTLKLHKSAAAGRGAGPGPHRRADRRHHLRPDPRSTTRW